MPDTGLREEIRHALRKYDNPEKGKNKLFQNASYLNELNLKYSMTEQEMREYAVSRRKRNKELK